MTDEQTYKPLCIESSALGRRKSAKPLAHRLLKWILPIVRVAEADEVRNSVHEQLSCRTSYPNMAWRSTNIDPVKAETILRLLADELEWPNHFFIPDDPISLALRSGTFDFDVNVFFHKVEKFTRKTISAEVIESLVEQGKLLKDLMRLLTMSDHSPSSASPPSG